MLLLTAFQLQAESPEVKAFLNSLEYDPVKSSKKIEEFLASRTLNEEDQLTILYTQGEYQAALGFLAKYEAIAQEGYERSKKLKDFKLITKFRISLASAFAQMSRWPEAKSLYDETLRSLKDSDYQELYGYANMNYGLSCYYNNELKSGLTYLTTAYNIFAETESTYLPAILQNIGLIYDATGDQIKAIQYFKKALSHMDEEKYPLAASPTYYNIGYTSIKINKLEEGEYYLNKSLEIAKKFNAVDGIAFALSQLGQLELKKKEYAVARGYVEETYKLSLELGNKRLENLSLFQLLEIYIKQKDFDKARETLKKLDWFLKHGDKQSQIGLLKLKAEMHMEQEQFKDAAEDAKKVFELFDLIYNENSRQEVHEVQNEFENQVEEQKRQLLEQKNELQALKISEQKKQNFIYLLGTAALSVIVIFLIIFIFREIKVRRKIAKMAMTDELTKVSNRRHITQKATEEFNRFKRYNAPCLYCILDLDFFKKINDSFGHDIGDYVLIKFAKAVTSVIREVDYFGRIGGEEWLLILPQASIEEAAQIYTKIVNQCLEIDVPDDCPKVTFSMGISILQPYDETAEDAIKRADTALYEAKRKGRNCYVVLS
ncbi:diguanylate cyclase [Aliikangiella maris]|uniref:diguanylate cyclase n=1 Tax=Aliikangiella maris TaxID=3162458 RepID=A0ABV3MN23_9GAMM